jgi:hypothetical protein
MWVGGRFGRMDGSEGGGGFPLLSSFRGEIPETGEGKKKGGRIKRPKIVNDHNVQ